MSEEFKMDIYRYIFISVLFVIGFCIGFFGVQVILK